MKSVLFALDGVLRDAEGEPIRGNIALARALYCAGHDVLVNGPRDGYEWLRSHDVTFDKIVAVYDAGDLMLAVVSDEAVASDLKNAGVHVWRYENG